MKKLLIIVPAIILAAWCVVWLLWGGIPRRIDTSFATKIYLKDHYFNKVDVTVTNADDVKRIKMLLNGWTRRFPGESATMFDAPNLSITLTDGHESIIFYPVFSDTRFEVGGETGRYVCLSDKQKKSLNRISKKYGVVLP